MRRLPCFRRRLFAAAPRLAVARQPLAWLPARRWAVSLASAAHQSRLLPRGLLVPRQHRSALPLQLVALQLAAAL